jgi:RNA polymerase sigma-70 factor, ECF subfamily
MSVESTSVLLLRARQGEPLAREELAGRYLTILKRWAHGRLPAKVHGYVDTDDLVQSTLARAFRKLNEFEQRGEGAFLAYLRQILLNQIRDEARRGKRTPDMVGMPEDLPAKGRSPIEEMIGADVLAGYEAALARLTENQRNAVILRIELGYRYREVAEAMELPSPNAARMLVARALVQLAAMLRNHGRE